MITKEQEEELIGHIYKQIKDDLPYGSWKNERLEEEIEKLVDERTENMYCPIRQKASIVQQIYSSIRGLGILDSIMKDSSITEVMINGHENIFVERNGQVEKLDMQFESEEKLNIIVQRIVQDSGREVNQSNPIVDTSLKGGSRVNIVLPPVSLVGPVVTIRKFSRNPMTVDQLIKYGSITEEIAEFLKTLVEARFNIFISGGTGSGKTTFLNALSNFIPSNERIITIEDSAELQIVNIPNIVRLETRNENSSGKGKITIQDLIKSSLRMRPDRIVVGEVRGEEALDMLQAMNTGHDGSLSTGHANSTSDMMSRLETMVLQGSSGMPLPAVRGQIASAIDIIIHLSRLRDHTRKTVEISEVMGLKADGTIDMNILYEFVEDENTSQDHVSGRLQRTDNDLKKKAHLDKLQMAGKSIYI